MKKIGLVGGMSWVSTSQYYEQINRDINQCRGGVYAADMVIRSLDFGAIQDLGWPKAYPLLRQACLDLQMAGAEVLALCANTAHLHADELEHELGLTLIQIGTATAAAAGDAGFGRVGLLGTIYTMERDFYASKFRQRGIDVLIPEDSSTREYMQLTLRDEMGVGVFRADTKAVYLDIIDQLLHRGAQAIVMGCTEIPLLIDSTEVPVPVLDSTAIHVRAIVDAAMR